MLVTERERERETYGEEKVKNAAALMSEKIRNQVMYLLFLDSFI